MKVCIQNNSCSKIFIALVLSLSAACPILASAEEDMPDNAPGAPCGELHLIGKQSYIFNQSDFTSNVKFKLNADRVWGHSINAGAVKYLAHDSNSHGVWRDTGHGDYRSSKTYTVPVKSHEVATIIYCASNVEELSWMTGEVSFAADTSEAGHPIPEGSVVFKGWNGYVDYIRGYSVSDVRFKSEADTPYVYYNANPYGVRLDGSVTICPHDARCSLP